MTAPRPGELDPDRVLVAALRRGDEGAQKETDLVSGHEFLLLLFGIGDTLRIRAATDNPGSCGLPLAT